MTEAKLLKEFDKHLNALHKKMRKRFIEGRKSHGQNKIEDIDYAKEIEEEMMDTLIYTMMKNIAYGKATNKSTNRK